MTIKRGEQFGDCSIRWLPRTAMRPAGPDISHTDCILVVGISRPKFAALFLALIMTSLFLTFHMLYDNALYNIQTASSKHRLPISPVAMLKVNYRSGSNSIDDHQQILLPNQFHFPKTSKRLPQTLIIGVRKCGTRALLEMLYLHPRIQKASGEVHFFDRDENYLRGLEWYRKKMPPSFRGQITIEKSPSYFVSPEVPERIRAMNASIKLLLIVREPVTRAISDYTQLRSHAATASLPMETPLIQQQHQRQWSTQSMGKQQRTPQSNGGGSALTTLPVQLSSSKSFEELAIFSNGTVNDAYRPLTTSMYHLHLHRWLEVFPREQIFIVNGDQLIHNPVSQLKKIESFLGLEHRLSTRNFYFNKTKGFYCLRYHSGDRCLRETKGRKHPYINPGIISKLRQFFADHNQKFYELIGEDFGWPEE